MTLEQIHYVLEVAKTGSINQAASNLFMSQSALSQAIKGLENELGIPLFSRTNRGAELTPTGRAFVNYATPIEMQIKQFENLFLREERKNSISFTLANDGFRFPGEICAQLFKKFESVGIRIEHLDSYGDEARNLVAQGVAEVGVIRLWSCYKKIELNQFRAMGLRFHSVYEAPISIMLGQGNPLFYEALESVTPEMLTGFPMIKYGFLDCGPFADIVEKLGLRLTNSSLVTSSRAVIYEMLKSTSAYYISSHLPKIYAEDEMETGRRSIPLTGTNIRSEIGWITKKDITLTHIAKEFINLFEDKFLEYF